MAETPSHRRRKGRNAFEPGVDPMDVQPYKEDTWAYEHDLEDWLEGWKEAEKKYEAQMEAEDQTQLMEMEEAEASYQRFLINKARYDEEHRL